jgi:hypothetical protein
MIGKNPSGLWACLLGAFALIPLVVGMSWGYPPKAWPWPVGLGMVIALTAFIVGICGLRYSKKHPAAGGAGYSIAGIVLGGLMFLGYLGLFLSEVAEHLLDPHMH